MARITLLLLLHLLLLLLEKLAISAISSSSSNVIQPQCESSCGGVSIPYPFGIGPNCSREGFELTCEEDVNGFLRPFLENHNVSLSSKMGVIDISLPQGQVRVRAPISYACYNESGYRMGNKSSSSGNLFLDGSIYQVSAAMNTFVSVGCDTFASISGISERANVTSIWCAPVCYTVSSPTNGSCSGLGCCQSSIGENLNSFDISFLGRINDTVDILKSSPCNYGFVAEKDWFQFDTRYLKGESFKEKYSDGVPMILEWTVGDENCAAAEKNAASYECRSANSVCIDSTRRPCYISRHPVSGPGYICDCTRGYQGNPYLTDGCQDIDECKPPRDQYPCHGICTNTEGDYDCTCPPGTYSKDPKKNKCDPVVHASASAPQGLPLWVKASLGVGIGFVSSLVISLVTYIEYKKRKLAKDKERFFKQNGGLILYEEIKATGSTTIFKIFRKEELERATNMFDKNQILGRGGHGTVYLGTFEGNVNVAIKKSRLIDEKQRKEFVKEILILSQINHKNVVKLLGCCLEVEVPMLVYEFIPNGTLHEYIHTDNRRYTIPLDTRLRIAIESAEALAYLHSSATPPILHGDIKSSNILLDENFVARVSDFGASTLVAMDEIQLATMVQGTFGYLDPEYIQTYVFTEKSDVYSFGVVLLELLTRKKAFYIEASNEEERSLASYFISLIKENRVTECFDDQLINQGETELLHEAAELVKQCLSIKGGDRPTMKEVAKGLQRLRRFIQHPWEEQHHLEEIQSLLGESLVHHAADSTGFLNLDTSAVLSIERGR